VQSCSVTASSQQSIGTLLTITNQTNPSTYAGALTAFSCQ
jgi:hypothetical protein